jgi:ribosome-associated toxin RatA of RatAB toxin-antitoxin module
MVDSTQSSIVVSATPTAVLEVIAAFESYPEWTGAVREVSILEHDTAGRPIVVQFTLDAGALKDTYSLAYSWNLDSSGEGTLSWNLVEATLLKAMTGSYQLTAAAGGTKVVYSLSVDLHIPMLGMLRRRAEKVITDTALTELKKRVEG